VSLLPVLSAREVIRALEKAGFRVARQKGSHAILQHPAGRRTVVPMHKGEDLEPGLLLQILRDAGISQSRFLQLLK
jgi:predicted RNA binding protein YcfA (HicA-like mRNA interferase family)